MNIRQKLIFIISLAILTIPGYSQKPSTTYGHLEIDNIKLKKSEFFGSQELRNVISGKPGLYKKAYSSTMQHPREKALDFSREFIGQSIKKTDNIEVDARVFFESESPVGHHIRLKQTVNGIPVYGSHMAVSINKLSGEVTSVSTAFHDEIDVNSTDPAITGQSAQNIAENYLNASKDKIFEKTELTILHTKTSGFKLTYLVWLVPHEPLGEWHVFVDALTGEILHVRDIARYDQKKYSDGQGKVWDPDPLTTAGVIYGGAYQDFSDADTSSLNDERVEITLHDLSKIDGKFILSGPYVKLADLESPFESFPELQDSSLFKYTRSQQEFEAVMVYYHIDKSYRHLMDLGFSIPGLLEFKVDPHGLNGADNSHYVSGTNYVSFGEGGVDDAEDADVIWHEYAHAIQENAAGGMSYLNETQSLQEGSSDYWAVSYSRSISDSSWEKVFTWDGHNEFWGGRIANLSAQVGHYPEYYITNTPHNGGQLWSSALMEIWDHLGREVTDKLFIQAHYIWGYSPGFQQAAAAFLQADHDLYDNAHFEIIYSVFESRGLINPNHYKPAIVHTPIFYTEDLIGPYRITAAITENVIPLDQSSIDVLYAYDKDSSFVSLSMTRIDMTDEYEADIPAAESMDFTVWYYITAANDSGEISTDPYLAPPNYHSFRVLEDSLPPAIDHAPLADQTKVGWLQEEISATITDNLAVDSVWVEYDFRGTLMDTSGKFLLTPERPGLYSGFFDIDTNDISLGDSVFYRIFATDKAINQNLAQDPFDSMYSFQFKDYVSDIVDDPDEILPRTFALEQNYPNPFNPSTTISYTIPVVSRISIHIYNVTGQLVNELVSATVSAGVHNAVWDGKNDRGIPMSSGIYFYQLRSGKNIFTKHMLLLK